MASEAKASKGGWLRALPGIVAALAIAATQVGPDDATKNLQAWGTRLGVTWPNWLTAKGFLWGLGFVVVGFYIVVYRKHFLRALRAFRDPASKVLTTDPATPHTATPGLLLEREVIDRANRFEAMATELQDSDRKLRAELDALWKEHGKGKENEERLRQAQKDMNERWVTLQQETFDSYKKAVDRLAAAQSVLGVIEREVIPQPRGLPDAFDEDRPLEDRIIAVQEAITAYRNAERTKSGPSVLARALGLPETKAPPT